MWEQLTPADIQRVKQRLAAQRIETLTRHMEEIRSLDEDQAETEKFERLVAAFATKHMIAPTVRPSTSTATEDRPAEAVERSEPSLPNGAQDGQIQVVLPSQNFGVPLRRLVRG